MHTDARGYAYETFRQGGRVCRRYIGRGEAISGLIERDQRERQRAAQTKQSERATRQQEQLLLDAQIRFCNLTQALLRAELESSGYHQHKRGAWRRRRDTPNDMAKTKTPSALVGAADIAPFDFKSHLLKAGKGDTAAAVALWTAAKDLPQMRELIANTWGDVAALARDAMVKRVFKDHELSNLATREKMQEMERELRGANSSPLERLLVERVVSCWLTLAYFEALYARTMGDLTLSESAFHQKRIDGAHRRYLDSIKALATVRKLQLPNVQVNIGEKQVNVANLSTGESLSFEATNR